MSDKKKMQLGMNPSTANGRLRKDIMYMLAQRCGMDICHQCSKKIDTVEEFSVEHKEPWLDSENPVKMFFDMGNIAFSHLKCNIGVARKYGKYKTEEERLEARRVSTLHSNRKQYTPEKRRERYLRTGR